MTATAFPAAPARASETQTSLAKARAHRQIAAWLVGVAILLIAMIMLGGLTRLTQSGLSITEWKPVTGVLPPLSQAAWASEFSKYQTIPEYRYVHSGISLEDFKTLYWWEWSHRLLGRLIGLAFLLPFVYFLATRPVARALAPRLAVLFVLGGLQGVLGWFMVKSGLSVRTDVSQYRLAAHLAAAFLIYGAVLWTIFDLMRPDSQKTAAPVRTRTLALALVALVSLQVIAGAFVAGLDAGLVYNTWPLMNGRLVPHEALALLPWYRNPFENPAMAQTVHRMIAYLVLGLSIFVVLDARRRFGKGAPAYRSAHILAGLIGVQVVLGITTLVLVVPLPLAAAHQLTAALVFAAALYHAHGLFARKSAQV
jgi:cytochrome c oxidase assembly protein subunit 15